MALRSAIGGALPTGSLPGKHEPKVQSAPSATPAALFHLPHAIMSALSGACPAVDGTCGANIGHSAAVGGTCSNSARHEHTLAASRCSNHILARQQFRQGHTLDSNNLSHSCTWSL